MTENWNLKWAHLTRVNKKMCSVGMKSFYRMSQNKAYFSFHPLTRNNDVSQLRCRWLVVIGTRHSYTSKNEIKSTLYFDYYGIKHQIFVSSIW